MACLAERRDATALPRVIEFFSHERRGLRLAAIQAAQLYEDPRFPGPLEAAALQDKDDEARAAATEVLDGYGSEGVATAASIREQRRKQDAVLLGNIELEMESDLVDSAAACCASGVVSHELWVVRRDQAIRLRLEVEGLLRLCCGAAIDPGPMTAATPRGPLVAT